MAMGMHAVSGLTLLEALVCVRVLKASPSDTHAGVELLCHKSVYVQLY